MKCFLVVNQLNNPIFLDFDADFTNFIYAKAVEVGLHDPRQRWENGEIDVSVVTQLFSPLVLSQVPLDDQVHNPCTSIHCPGGLLLVFRKVDDIQYIAISSDGKESEDFLARKILVFTRVIKLLFGPVFTEIANCSTSERAARWSFLKSLLHTWENMASNDQTFLVEAVERLHVNQLVSEKCVELLETIVRKLQSDQPTQHAFLLVNSKLLALYSERSTFELQSADILLMTLLAQDTFPAQDPLELLTHTTHTYTAHQQSSTTQQQTPEEHQEEQSPREGTGMRGQTEEERSDDENEEEFHSAPNTPSQRSPTPATSFGTRSSDDLQPASHHTLEQAGAAGQSEKIGRERSDGGVDRVSEGSENAPRRGRSTTSLSRESAATESSLVETEYPMLSPQATGQDAVGAVSATLRGKQLISDVGRTHSSSITDDRSSGASQGVQWETTEADAADRSSGIRSRSATDPSIQHTAAPSKDCIDYWPHSVFLQTPACLHAPHALHCAQILPGITLVIVSQMLGYAAADPLCQVVNIVQDLLQGRRNQLTRQQAQNVHDVVCSLLRKIHNICKKLKSKQISKSSGDVLARWENQDMLYKLTRHLQEEETSNMPPDLESPLMELQRRLKDLFQQLFVLPGCSQTRQGGEGRAFLMHGREIISKTKVRMQQELMDYRDYLNVKAQRNITMTSYLDDYPGLVHFIYVDRQYHQMTAPSFNIIPDKDDGTAFLKKKIWEMYRYMMKKLQQGYTTVLLREGDFCFSYFLWFEDSSSNQVPVQEPYKPNLTTPIPGILTSSFYRRLLRQCFPNRLSGTIHCCEMFLMHVGLVTPQYIAAHCQKLSRKLWEMSGEAYRPVNLL